MEEELNLSFILDNDNITLTTQIRPYVENVAMNLTASICSLAEPNCEGNQHIWTNLTFNNSTTTSPGRGFNGMIILND